MPGLERLGGSRVVAVPTALDAARWHGGDVTILRFAPDDAFGLGAETVDVDDEHAIVEAEAGYVGVWLAIGDLEPHLEWPLPAERPCLAQGAVAGVPAKVWLPGDRDDDRALLLTAAAYAAELAGRLR